MFVLPGFAAAAIKRKVRMKKTLLALAFALLTLPAYSQEKLSIMLDWFVNPDHGPIIVAQQKGYFADVGLDVEIIAPADPTDPPKLAAAGQVDLAVSYQPQLYLQHDAGLPLKRVGTLVNNPLYCVMVDADGPIKSLADLKGKTVGFSIAGIEEALMHTMLRHNGVDPESVEQINVNFSLTPSLVAGKVDAVSGAFRNFELHQMTGVDKKGTCFLPEEHGVPAYDELIYVANTALDGDDRITRFLEATAKAAKEIKADPQAGWETFKGYASELDDRLNALAWGDTVPHFETEPSTLNEERYSSFGEFMKSTGLIGKAPPVADIAR